MSAPEKNVEAGRILAEMVNLARFLRALGAHADGRATDAELMKAGIEWQRIHAQIQEWTP